MAKAKRVSSTASSKAKDRATAAGDWRRKLERDRAAFQTFAASDAGKRFLANQKSSASYAARLPRPPTEALKKWAALAERLPDWTALPGQRIENESSTARQKRGGGRRKVLSDEDAAAAQVELARFLDDHPSAKRDEDAIPHIQNWLESEKNTIVGSSTARNRIAIPVYGRRPKTRT